MVNVSIKLSEEVHRIMQSIEGIQRATPSPFFYARVINRISNTTKSNWEILSEFISRPIIAAFIIFFIATIDSIALFEQQSKNESLSSESIAAQYQEYSTITSNFYDVPNENDVDDDAK